MGIARNLPDNKLGAILISTAEEEGKGLVGLADEMQISNSTLANVICRRRAQEHRGRRGQQHASLPVILKVARCLGMGVETTIALYYTPLGAGEPVYPIPEALSEAA